MRVVVLWKQLSGYAARSFAELTAVGVDVSVVYRAAQADAPFDDNLLVRGMAATSWDDRPDEASIMGDLWRLRPDAVLFCSWDIGGYRRIAGQLRGRSLRVLCMDNQWLGTAKQWAGLLISPVVIRPDYDLAFLPGERQAQFARRLGFTDDRIMEDLYCCDYERFAAVHPAPDANAFVFTGRLVREKGVDVLAQAYAAYRQTVPDPWPLIVAGTGSLASVVDAVPGVEMLGFVQPADLPSMFARASCLVLPSRFEPWGVVVHEAASVGLGLICSTACGAGTRFVRPGVNGTLVEPGDVAALCSAMTRMSTATAEERLAMEQCSRSLAAGLTPRDQAVRLVDRIGSLRAELRLSDA